MNELMFLGRMVDGTAIADYTRRLNERASLGHTIQEAIKEARTRRSRKVITLPTAAEETVVQPEAIEGINLPMPTAVIEHEGVTLRVFANIAVETTQPEEQTTHIEQKMESRAKYEASVLTAASDMLSTITYDISNILEKTEPSRWWFKLTRYMKRLERNMEKHPENYPAPLREFIQGRMMQHTYQALAAETAHKNGDRPVDLDTLATRAHEVIDKVCDAAPYREEAPVEVQFLPMEELVAMSDRLRVTEYVDTETGKAHKMFEVRSVNQEDPSQEKWYSFPLPEGENIWHKGGLPRLVIKILAGAPVETLLPELPVNDLDVIAYGESEAVFEEALRMGVDREGVEMMKDRSELAQLLTERDTDISRAILGKDGLYYTHDAWEAAGSGKIAIVTAERKLYGGNAFFYDNIQLTRNRGLMRLVKFIVEGKAVSFDFTPLNKQVDLGNYLLALTKKLSKKSNGGELMNRLFYVIKQIGQVKEGEEDLYAVLDRIHSEHPFFDFQQSDLDAAGVTQWLTRKLGKHIRSSFKFLFHVPSGAEFTRQENDDKPYRVSLDGYDSRPEDVARLVEEWPRFVQRCVARTQAYNALSDEEKQMLRMAKIAEAEKTIGTAA